jgi:hypothetical protein
MNRLISWLTWTLQVLSSCTWVISSWSIWLSDWCIMQQQVPIFPVQAIIDAARPHIKWFEGKYEPFATEQVRNWTQPIRDEEVVTHRITPNNFQTLKINWINWIFLPIENVLPLLAEQIERSPAHRTIDNYGNCAKQNYLTAAQHFGNVILQPGEEFEINQHIAHLDWYCKWTGEEYMFYQWVCWLSTQLFRAWLINPDIEIVRRAPHSKRYTKYYGETVYGDDSAIYENLKKMVIKNRGNHPIQIRTLSWATEHYLVIMWPKTDKQVLIQKSESDKLTWRLGRKIYDNGELVEKQIWQSTYNSKFRESN